MRKRTMLDQQVNIPRSFVPSIGHSFSGHETFSLRYGWLKKAVDAALADPDAFHRDDAVVTLGVGKNMVRSIRHWALATRVLEEEPGTRGARVRPSSFGNLLFGLEGRDPYLEDPSSLWLLHWQLVTNEPRASTWFWAFHKCWLAELSRESFTEALRDEIRRMELSRPPTAGSLRRDVDAFFRTYVPTRPEPGTVAEDGLECPLTELALIVDIPGTGLYRLRRGPKRSLDDRIFAYALADFWERWRPAHETLAFSDIAYAPGSPGNAFKLDENSLIDRLELLESVTEGHLTYVETAGLKQVYRRGQVPAADLLERCYAETLAAPARS
jgi:hypothetical protein